MTPRRKGGSARWTSRRASARAGAAMAKGQKKSNKELRKPKADKKTVPVSASPFIVTSGKK
jgi:hypothetical protein